MKNTILILVILVVIFSSNLKAQQDTKTDSLKQILKTEIADTLRLKTLSKLLRIYSDFDSLRTVEYFEKTILLAEKLNKINYLTGAYYDCGLMYLFSGYPLKAEEIFNKQFEISSKQNYIKGKAKAMQAMGILESMKGNNTKGLEKFKEYLKYSLMVNDSAYISSAYQNISKNYSNQGKYKDALKYSSLNLDIQRKLNNDKSLAITLNGVGIIYYAIGNYPMAMEYYLEALKINEKIDFKKGKSRNYNNIGIIYFEQEDYKQALEYFQNALKLKSELKDEYGKAYTLSRIGEVYDFMAEDKMAIEYLNKALILRKRIGDINGAATSYMQIGNFLTKKNKLKAASDSLQKSLELYQQINRKPGIAAALLALGKIEVEINNDKRAIAFFLQAYNISEKIGELHTVRDASIGLANTYSKLNDYKKAFEYHVVFKKAADSILNEKNTKKITQQSMQFEFDKEKTEIELENRKNELLKENELRNQRYLSYGFIILAIVIFIILILIYRNNRIKQKANKLLTVQKHEIQTQAEELISNLEKITELTEFREDMMQMIVHDLKNPLNALMNLPKALSPEEKRQIRKYSALKMHNLVMNILDLKQYEDTKLKIYPKTISISKIWNKAVEQQQYLINQKNIEVKNIGKHEANVKADAELTERVITNLLSNALKYTRNNGSVILNCEKYENAFCKISITDNGYGIPKDILPSIFDKYQQSGNKMKYSTGLGLTFCKIAVEQHGGIIKIESKENEGTVVWFTLPASNPNHSVEKQVDEIKTTIISETEKHELLKFIHRFEALDLSEITSYRKIFKEIQNKNIVNKEWFASFKNAVYHCNEVEYNKFIDEIKT